MRTARILLPLLAALAVAACARQPQTQYVMDPMTGRPVPVVQHYGGANYTQTASTQQGQERGFFNSSHGSSFAFFGRQQSAPSYAPAYAQQPYATQAYAPPSYATPAYGQQAYAQQAGPQNGHVQQRSYGRYGYVMQYQPPQQTAAHAYAAAPYGYGYAYAPAAQSYTLDSGDRLRVVVFGQEGITGTYMVDAGGSVSMPLIGAVPARGFTTQQLSSMIADRLKQGYVREPHVTVEIASYRPFFILGEVTTPGQYPYVPNMTAENAIAIAGGFAPRANKSRIELTRNTPTQRFKGDVPLNYPLRPGDTIVVKERWF